MDNFDNFIVAGWVRLAAAAADMFVILVGLLMLEATTMEVVVLLA